MKRSTNTSISPPQGSPIAHACSSAIPYETTSRRLAGDDRLARSATSASTQPPETEPKRRPSADTASFDPSGRGALRREATTVASATCAPAARHSSAFESTSSIDTMLVTMDPLDDLLARLDTGELGDPLPVLAYVAGASIEIDDSELNGARRRALLLVAAGGDPHRELDVDDRAVKSIAADLFTTDRRAQLARGIDELVLRVRDLPTAREGAIFLAGDVDLAWRLYTLGLLAEELAE